MNLRKLFSMTVVLALGITISGPSSPASAWPDYTTPSSSSSISSEGEWVIPIGKTVSSDAVFVYTQNPDSGSVPRYLRSYTVSPNGTINGPQTIATNTDAANYMVSENSVWLDSSGVFNVVFWTWKSVDPFLESKLYHATSSDGMNWNTPVLLDSFTGSGTCAQSWCGLRSAQVAQSSTGTVAITYVISEQPSEHKLYYRTKPKGKAWSARAVLNSSSTLQDSILLKELGKGWLATWGAWGIQTQMYSAYSTGDKITSWTAPQLRESATCSLPRVLQQTGISKYGLVYITGCEEGSDHFTIKYQSFDLATKRFGQPVVLDQSPNSNWMNFYGTAYRAGQSAVGYSFYVYAQGQTGYAKYILFRNGTPSVQFLNESAAVESRNQVISGASMDLLGHLTLVWTTNAGSISVKASQIYRGNRSDVELLINNAISGQYAVVFSPDDDIYLTNLRAGDINSIVRVRSDAPDLSGVVNIIGNAKANSTLKAKNPMVLPTQLKQIWKFSYQWYSCQYQVPESTTIATVGCDEISNANAATYKAKASDKGRYLQVRLTVRSDNASQVQYSASTGVVK